jgi:sugar/nucleoside kinase (ribokinase family)
VPSHDEKLFDVAAVGSWSNFDHLFGVERLPQPGDTVQITSSIESVERVYWGGCAPNNAAAAAKLEAKAALVSVVGHDFRERGYQAYFDELGINLAGTIIVEDGLSGHSFLFSDSNGDAICISHLGVAAYQDEFEPDAGVLSASKITILNYRFDRFVLRAAQIAAESGGTVITSGALVTGADYAGAIVDLSHILVCTQHELDQLVRHLHLLRRESLFERGIQALVITRGRQGSYIVTPDGATDVPIVPANQVVDPVGAGDGFVGGLAAGLAFGYPLVEAACLGAVVASFVVEAVGCQTNLPSREQATQRLHASQGRIPGAKFS